jgi:hypothetical protein
MAALTLKSWILLAALMARTLYADTQAAQPAGSAVVLTNINLHVVNPQVSGPESAGNTAIRSNEEWNAFWLAIEPRTSREMGQRAPNPPPLVDFSRHVLLVAALGAKRAGHSVSITAARDVGDKIVVDVLVKVTAGANCTYVMWATYPIAFAMIPATPKPIDFHKRERTTGCGSQQPPNQSLERSRDR